jgi:hypothetical protein
MITSSIFPGMLTPYNLVIVDTSVGSYYINVTGNVRNFN